MVVRLLLLFDQLRQKQQLPLVSYHCIGGADGEIEAFN